MFDDSRFVDEKLKLLAKALYQVITNPIGDGLPECLTNVLAITLLRRTAEEITESMAYAFLCLYIRSKPELVREVYHQIRQMYPRDRCGLRVRADLCDGIPAKPRKRVVVPEPDVNKAIRRENADERACA